MVRVVVTDERGRVLEQLSYGTFMGSLESRIEYVLEPDIEGGSWDGSGIMEVDDLFGNISTAIEGEASVEKLGICSGAVGDGWVGPKGGFQVKHGKGHRPRERVKHIRPKLFF